MKKIIAEGFEYRGPRFIWVEQSTGLDTSDAIVVDMSLEERDFTSPALQRTCDEVADWIRESQLMSVEVIRSIDGGIKSVSWRPTDEDMGVYGG